MALSSNLAVDRLKLSNSAGNTTINTGGQGMCSFIPKLKTPLTMRNFFGENPPWADTFSFSDYVNCYYDKSFGSNQPVIINTPTQAQIHMQSIILSAGSGDGIIDAMTGNIVSGIVYLSLTTFAHDIGNVPLPSCSFLVQSTNANTNVGFFNGNRGYGLIQLV